MRTRKPYKTYNVKLKPSVAEFFEQLATIYNIPVELMISNSLYMQVVSELIEFDIKSKEQKQNNENS